MKVYNNQEEIRKDLEILRLERNISLEELKILKHSFKNALIPNDWIQFIFKGLGKVSLYKFLKKII